MVSLDDVGKKYRTDKSSVSRVDSEKAGHDYLRKYEFYLNRFKDLEVVRFLELGIGPDWNMGASALMWLEYFGPESIELSVADINSNAIKFQSKGVDIYIGDCGSEEFLRTLSEKKYDVIVDDASHFWGHQILSFETLFDSVNYGGVYIVEDVHTSFGTGALKYSEGSEIDAFTYFSLLSSVVAGRGRSHCSHDKFPVVFQRLKKMHRMIDSVIFIKHAVVITRSGYY